MILIGQYDSPFVRRVGIALRYYDIDFEHRPWSVFRDADKIAAFNPLRRVPTLVLDDGEVAIESTIILDCLDQMVGPERALIPASGDERRQALKICALATGLADKAVSLMYESALHSHASETWIERCRGQIADVLKVLEAVRADRPPPWLDGEEIGHADIALACALRFVGEVHADLYAPEDWPALADHAERCEDLPVFQEISQPFSPPA